MKKVLVVGSANMDYTVYVNDFPKNGETIFGKNRSIQPGGKGENQAVALGKSNKVLTYFVGAVGNDNDGKCIESVLKENNVIPYLKIDKEAETGNATIIVDKTSENKIIVVPGANEKLEPKDIDLALLKECDYLVIQNEISGKTNEFLIKKAKEYGKIVVYNPAPFKEFNDDLFKHIDYFIPNEGELENYTHIKDTIKAAQSLVKKGCLNVIVTLGSRGSMLINKDRILEVPAYKVEAVDTVAAGDTFVGYFVAGIASGLKISEAMDRASYASSKTVSRKGSVNSIPLGKEVFKTY